MNPKQWTPQKAQEAQTKAKTRRTILRCRKHTGYIKILAVENVLSRDDIAILYGAHALKEYLSASPFYYTEDGYLQVSEETINIDESYHFSESAFERLVTKMKVAGVRLQKIIDVSIFEVII